MIESLVANRETRAPKMTIDIFKYF